FDITAKCVRQISPALAELAGSEHQNSVTRRCKIRNCSFHNAGTRRCQYQYIILRADEILHVSEYSLKQRTEVRGAVVHGERSHGSLGRGKDRRWSRSEETILAQHLNGSN